MLMDSSTTGTLNRRDTNTITVDLKATNNFAYDLNGNMLTNGPALIKQTEPDLTGGSFFYSS